MSSTHDQEEFMRLFHEVEQDLFGYLVVLVANEADAADILQETAVVLWHKFDEYDSQYPFVMWARTFAYLQANKFRLYRAREGKHRAMAAEELFRQFNEDYEKNAGVLELRLAALEKCVGKLTAEDRELIDARYATNKSLRALASERQVNEDQLYRRLQKIRKLLEKCIQQTLATEGI